MPTTREPFYYVLNDRMEPVPEDDIMRWSDAFEQQRILKNTVLNYKARVCSIFHGFDIHYGWAEVPAFFATALLEDGKLVRECHFATYAECMKDHETLVNNLLEAGLKRRKK